MKLESYNGWEIHHYPSYFDKGTNHQTKEEFMACQDALVLRATSLKKIKQKINLIK